MVERRRMSMMSVKTVVVPDRRTAYAREREQDASAYIREAAEEHIAAAIAELEKLELKKCYELPTRTHVKIAEMVRKRLIKRLQKVRNL
jgi:hypothetical protein